MPGPQSPLSLLSPGGFMYNDSGHVGVGRNMPFASVFAQSLNTAGVLAGALTAANVGAVASGLTITSGQITSGAPFVATANYMIFTSVAVSGVVQLNPSVSGLCEILNRGTATLTAYPALIAGSGQIEALGNNVGVAVASGTNGKFLYAGVNGASGHLWYEP